MRDTPFHLRRNPTLNQDMSRSWEQRAIIEEEVVRVVHSTCCAASENSAAARGHEKTTRMMGALQGERSHNQDKLGPLWFLAAVHCWGHGGQEAVVDGASREDGCASGQLVDAEVLAQQS